TPACGCTRCCGPSSPSSAGSGTSTVRRRGTAVAKALKEKIAVNGAQPEVVIDPTREPIVVVDGLHIVYRVYSAGGGKGTAATALLRILRRENRPQMKEVHAVRGVSFIAYRGDAIGVI